MEYKTVWYNRLFKQEGGKLVECHNASHGGHPTIEAADAAAPAEMAETKKVHGYDVRWSTPEFVLITF